MNYVVIIEQNGANIEMVRLVGPFPHHRAAWEYSETHDTARISAHVVELDDP
jgi:hypothetical protein